MSHTFDDGVIQIQLKQARAKTMSYATWVAVEIALVCLQMIVLFGSPYTTWHLVYLLITAACAGCAIWHMRSAIASHMEHAELLAELTFNAQSRVRSS